MVGWIKMRTITRCDAYSFFYLFFSRIKNFITQEWVIATNWEQPSWFGVHLSFCYEFEFECLPFLQFFNLSLSLLKKKWRIFEEFNIIIANQTKVFKTILSACVCFDGEDFASLRTMCLILSRVITNKYL